MMKDKITALLFLLCSIATLFGQSDKAVLSAINQAADSTSSVMHSISYLSDVYGPRLMGTPQYYQSTLWIKERLKSWGIDRVELQSFDNNYVGWSVEDFSVKMTDPNIAFLNAYPLAYSTSTDGVQTGTPVVVNRFKEVFELKDSLKGKIIFLKGYYRPVSNLKGPFTQRLSDDVLKAASANPDPNDVLIGYHSRRSSVDVFGWRARVKKQRMEFFEFCKEQGVVAVFEPSNFPYGILHADGNRTVPSFSKAEDVKPLPSFVLSNEHFGRIIRLVELGISPKIEVKLKTRFYDNPDFNVNVIAELPGNDPLLKHEQIVIGAHLDSWHAGTGAVDNASNCAVMMEVMRIIKQTGLKPKRTIRLILWGGEEQVFAGSSFYVNERIGNFETGNYKPENEVVSTYLNLDNGAGMIRGIYLSGNEAIAPYFAEYLAPFEKSNTLTIQNANQTDHELFDYFNVPAFQFIQDPLDYMSAIHHTNMDVYEYAPEEDQIYNAKLIAYLTYKLAQAATRMPRKQFNDPKPSRKGNTTFQLSGYPDAKKVNLVGDFNNWNMFGTSLYKTEEGWECKVDLPKGRYYYKYIIDGYWTADPDTPADQLVKDGKGHGGLTVRVIK